MKRTHAVLVVALAVSAALVFPTAAAPDTINDETLILQPADNPNGAYAYYEDYRPSEGEELRLGFGPANPNLKDADGVASDTVSSFDRVFTVTNNGSEAAIINLTSSSERIQFYVGAETGNTATEVNLTPGETFAVGVLIDTRGLSSSSTTLDPDFSVDAAPADGTSGEGGTTLSSLVDDDDDSDGGLNMSLLRTGAEGDTNETNSDGGNAPVNNSRAPGDDGGIETSGNTATSSDSDPQQVQQTTASGSGPLQALSGGALGPLVAVLGIVALAVSSFFLIGFRRRSDDDDE
ncbi:MAG: DUF1102 domain-containing protein [Halobellus sp.]|uniref:DUF1102 domain-containing protein n=1 Tax=Halobellus sp. TaxID=1979212 RepID=UPI0035D4BDD9